MVEQIEMRLKQIIMKYSKLRIRPEDITNKSVIINDFGYDSVSTIKLVIDIENEFGIVFEDEDMDMGKLGRYASLKEVVTKKILF